MSRSVTKAARLALIGVAVALEVVVVYLLMVSPPANLAALLGSMGGLAVLAMHVLASALLAAGFGGLLPGGSASDRASVVILYFVVAFILPGAGVGGVAFLASLLGRGGKEAEGDVPFAVGNPLTRLPITSHAPETAHLAPLAGSLREFDTAQTRAAVLALRGRAGRPDVAALLRRFRGDHDSELQFFAGSAIDGAVERAEANANSYVGRVHDDPADTYARVGLADGLIKAARSTSVSGDRRRLALAAIDHLATAREQRPGSHLLAKMAGNAYTLAGDFEAATAALENESETVPERLELAHRRRDWAALRALAASGESVRHELAGAIEFWNTTREGASV